MFDTERLLLRPIAPTDNKQVFRYRSEVEANKYQGFVPTELKDVDDFIAKTPLEFNQPESWFQLVIIEKTTDEIIGDIGVHFIGDNNLQCELGCTLCKKHRGKGYATQAMKVTIDYLFNSLNKHRIIGSVDPENIDSIRLLERLQFRKEAHFKESLLINDKWVDDVVYAILKHEWKY